MSKGREAFKHIVANLDYPMFVLTTAVADQRSGCLVGFASQCSIDPPRFFVWVSKKNHTFALADKAPVFVVHALRETDCHLARLFGETTGDKIDKFEHCDWEEGPNGVPVLTACDWFAGTVIDRNNSGDHVGYLLDLLDAGRADHAKEPQLGFQAVRDLKPGHES
ncbi:MAG: hypothetical protein JWL83_4758 [Actinomycetia bacterium]|nr:hypothetical protein [Actinomycetes bacterium]